MKKILKTCLATGTTLAALLTIGIADSNATSLFYDLVKTKHITFEAAAPKTITDSQWQGTGFTHRLPGTGLGLLKNDANLAKDPAGLLTIKSTQTDINAGGINLNNLESLAVELDEVFQKDFAFSVILKNVQVSDASDQLFAFVGTDAQHIFRFGPHGTGISEAQLLSVESLGGSDFNLRSPNSFINGDDIKITMTRSAVNTYTIEYKNLTHPDLSATDTVQFDWLNNATKVYVGVLYSSPGTDVQKVSNIEDFRAYVKK